MKDAAEVAGGVKVGWAVSKGCRAVGGSGVGRGGWRRVRRRRMGRWMMAEEVRGRTEGFAGGAWKFGGMVGRVVLGVEFEERGWQGNVRWRRARR